jgi:hypothetical protein
MYLHEKMGGGEMKENDGEDESNQSTL